MMSKLYQQAMKDSLPWAGLLRASVVKTFVETVVVANGSEF